MLETLCYEPSSGSPPRLEHSSQYLKLSESYNGFYFILCDFSSSLKLFDPPQPHSLPVSGAGASIPNTPVKPLLLHKNIDHSSLLIMNSDGTSRRNKQLRGWKIISFWKRRGVQLRGFTVKDYKEVPVGSPQKFSLEQKEVEEDWLVIGDARSALPHATGSGSQSGGTLIAAPPATTGTLITIDESPLH